MHIVSRLQTLRPMRSFICGSLLAAAFLTGCASTKVETTGSPLKEPLCRTDSPSVSTLVYWGTKWRPDQKEPRLREAAALRGIQDFLSRSGCLSVIAVNRLTNEQLPESNEDLMRVASISDFKSQRVLLIVVRELGPRLLVGIPVILEGGTEVLIDVRVINAATSESLATTQILWRNGGTFVIKGIKTLDQDMSAALRSALMLDQWPK